MLSTNQELIFGVMPAIIRQRLLSILNGITIGTAVGAGVVGADVAAFGAEAAGAVAFLSGFDDMARDVRQAGDIDTASRGGIDVGLAADGQAHVMVRCRRLQIL